METTAAHSQSLAAGLRGHGFTGRLDLPGGPDYDSARACFNGEVDRRPAAIAHALDAEDVAAAIRFCRATGLTSRSAAAATRSPAARSATAPSASTCARCATSTSTPRRAGVRVGGGALLGELDARPRSTGSRFPAGQISHTGVGGLTLGGGLGWLMRHHGLTVDSLADRRGRARRRRASCAASADEHADLFWALRGGGGDFGVVTRFEFRARAVGPMVLGGMLVYPWEQASEASAAAAMMADAPDELTAFCVLLTAPPRRPFPPELQGRRAASSPSPGAARPRRRASVRSRRCARPARRRSTSSARCPTWRCSRCSTRPRRTAGGTSTACTISRGRRRVPRNAARAASSGPRRRRRTSMTAWMGGAIDASSPARRPSATAARAR